MNFVFIFLTPVVLYSRWYSYHFVTFTFISALLTTAGSVTATVMFAIFKRVISSQKELNISASLGAQMFAFMWIGSAFSIGGWIIHFHLACLSRKKEKSANKKDNAAGGIDGAVEKKRIGLRRRLVLPRF